MTASYSLLSVCTYVCVRHCVCVSVCECRRTHLQTLRWWLIVWCPRSCTTLICTAWSRHASGLTATTHFTSLSHCQLRSGCALRLLFIPLFEGITVHWSPIWGWSTYLSPQPLSIYFLIFCPFYFSLSFIGFTYFLLFSIPSLSARIVPLRFLEVVGSDRTWV